MVHHEVAGLMISPKQIEILLVDHQLLDQFPVLGVWITLISDDDDHDDHLEHIQMKPGSSLASP